MTFIYSVERPRFPHMAGSTVRFDEVSRHTDINAAKCGLIERSRTIPNLVLVQYQAKTGSRAMRDRKTRKVIRYGRMTAEAIGHDF